MRIADQLGVTCPVFYVDNVAEYYHSMGQFRAESRHMAPEPIIDPSTYPPCFPPFEDLWIEWYSPSYVTSKGYRTGWARSACRIETTTHQHTTEDGTQATHVARFSLYYESEMTGSWLPDFDRFRVSFDASGRVVGLDLVAMGSDHGHDDDMFTSAVSPCLLAISFMHCKNVERVEHAAVHRSGKGWREAKPWKVRHYTLEIDPMREVLRTEGQSETVGLARALHICRGHFRTYTAEKPLFGRGVGTVWVPSHTRGTIKAGAVVKDYSVKAPKPH